MVAETPYVIYIYCEDYGGNPAGNMTEISFQTDDLYNIAQFSLKFLVLELNDEQKAILLTRISNILKVSADLLDFRTDYTESSYFDYTEYEENDFPVSTTHGRGLETPSFILDILVYPDPYTYHDFTPLMYANSFKGQESSLLEAFASLDITYKYYATELIGVPPVLLGSPQVESKTNTDVTIGSIRTESVSKIYSCLVTLEDKTPSPWQIFKGLNSKNLPCLQSKALVTSYAPTSVKFDEINTGAYKICFAASNFVQKYPDLSESVIEVSFSIRNGKDANHGFYLSIWSLSLILTSLF